METKKDRVIAKPDSKELFMNGKYYRVRKHTYKRKGALKDHLSKVIWEEIDKEEYDKRVSKIAKKLSRAADINKVLESRLQECTIDEIELIERRLKKKETKVKEVNGCYGLDIGGYQLDILG